jgi:hypothetical protein
MSIQTLAISTVKTLTVHYNMYGSFNFCLFHFVSHNNFFQLKLPKIRSCKFL